MCIRDRTSQVFGLPSGTSLWSGTSRGGCGTSAQGLSSPWVALDLMDYFFTDPRFRRDPRTSTAAPGRCRGSALPVAGPPGLPRVSACPGAGYLQQLARALP
eukprot:6616385-Alexandrium_andersonii.AAC.1